MLSPCPHLKKNDEVEIFKINYDENINLCHIYMEAQIFTPDSKRFILHSGATPHGNTGLTPDLHRYYLCDIEDKCSLTPLTFEPQANAPCLSPDGKTMYYILDYSIFPEKNKIGIEIKSLCLDNMKRETLCVINGKIPGTNLFPGASYPLSTISSDGKHIAIKIKLMSKESNGKNNAIVVFDLSSGESWIPLLGHEWINIHPQYCRSLDKKRHYDIMVQHNHGVKVDSSGNLVRHHSGLGMDIHLISDDGTNFRDFPWGRAPDEICHGHQCWIGRSPIAIEQCAQRKPFYKNGYPCPVESPEPSLRSSLIAATPSPHCNHMGKFTSDSVRHDLCRGLEKPFFAHFATDIEGKRLIADSCAPPKEPDWRYLYIADLPLSLEDGECKWSMIADTKSLNAKSTKTGLYGTAHTHPFLSPDGSMGFFNSNESGILRPYIIKNLNNITP